jgi:hypothetical protein
MQDKQQTKYMQRKQNKTETKDVTNRSKRQLKFESQCQIIAR